MNVCQVITRLIVGGAQENTLLTCRGLAERGHKVTLIAGLETGPEGSLWGEARSAAFETAALPDLRRAVRPWADRRALRELTRRFRDALPDVVHTHSSKAGILARAAAAAAGVPIIVHTIHGMSFNRTQSAPVRAFYRLLERRAARYTSAWVAVADAMIDQSVAAGIAPRERFVTIRSGMETDAFAPCQEARKRVRAAWGIGVDEIVAGTIARLFPNKGYEPLLEALPSLAAALPRLRFLWVGDGPCRPRYLRRLAAAGLLDRVRFTGLVPPRDIRGMLCGFDLLIHASLWEGLPRAVVQALLCEVPAVSFDVDGAPEVVRHGETGFLVPINDTQRLADSVLRLASDAELRRSMGREGRLRCLREFGWRDMVGRIDALYARLAAARSRSA